MGLLDELEDASARSRPGPRCNVFLALIRVPPESRADLEEALARTVTIKASVLARHFMDRYGIHVGEQSISKHRRGLCQCQTRSTT